VVLERQPEAKPVSLKVSAVLGLIEEGNDPFFLPKIENNDSIPPVLRGTGMKILIAGEEVVLNRKQTVELGEELGRIH
jgi:hypothetical protein